jgi:hypothetical protein
MVGERFNRPLGWHERRRFERPKTIRATFVIARMQFVRRTFPKASHDGKKKARRDHAWRAAAGA